MKKIIIILILVVVVVVGFYLIQGSRNQDNKDIDWDIGSQEDCEAKTSKVCVPWMCDLIRTTVEEDCGKKWEGSGYYPEDFDFEASNDKS